MVHLSLPSTGLFLVVIIVSKVKNESESDALLLNNMSNDVRMPLLASLVLRLWSSVRCFKPVDVTSQLSLSPSICSTFRIMGFGAVGVLGAQLEFALHEFFVNYSKGDVLRSQCRTAGWGCVEGCRLKA